MNSKSFLVVGGVGYLGALTTEWLAQQGSKVFATFRNASADRTAWLKTLGDRVTPVEFDSLRPLSALRLPQSFDAIFNFATPSAAEAARDPFRAHEAARRVMANCLELTARSSATRLFHFSSFHVYGHRQDGIYSEDTLPTPSSSYGEIHLSNEELLRASRLQNFCVSRLTNVLACPRHRDLGPQLALIFLDACRSLAHGKTLVLKSNGAGYRDFVVEHDFLSWLEVLLQQSNWHQNCVNVAAGEPLTIRELVEKIALLAKGEEAKGMLQWGEGTDLYSNPFRVSAERAEKLGWVKRNGYEQVVLKTLEFFREAK